MGLREYRAKRDFRKSPEPKGRVSKDAKHLRFVVQKHDATRLHYDFRLEAEGVLKSWAVPKGPSLDPAEKRLAVEVEDHPLEYGSFEGLIPRGEYGGGTVLLWDTGEWIPEGDPVEGLRRGRLKFRLEGEKLHGGWALVRMRPGEDGKNNWLLIKEKDDEARHGKDAEITKARPESVTSGLTIEEIAKAPAPEASTTRKKETAKRAPKPPANLSTLPGARKGRLPDTVHPELATLVKQAPDGDSWLHEIKFDGYRVLCLLQKGRARFLTRHGKDWTDRFRPLQEAVAALPVEAALLDGEVVVMDGNRSSFQALQNALSGSDGRRLVVCFFDVLHLNGHDLTRVALEERKGLLSGLLSNAAGGPLRYSDHVVGGGSAFFREACRLQVEGMVSKRRDSLYVPGRGRDWLKIKCVNRQEFVIGGFTEPAGSRKGLGALLVGVHDGDGLRFAGKVGTGFDAKLLETLRTELEAIERKTPAFLNPPRGAAARGVHWVRPERVAEIEFTEWTGDGLLRHPSFVGLRDDKPASEVRREEPARSAEEKGPEKSGRGADGRARKRPSRSADRAGRAAPVVSGVTLTHPDRILYPGQGLTKHDLAVYYAVVAERMLPHVAGRPLAVVRCPEGRTRACFYQKHVGRGVPDGVDAVEIRESGGKIAHYLVVNDARGLLGLVQMGVLEIHTWGARQDDVEKPDRLVFDLDPDPDLPWKRVVEAAIRVRDLLQDLGLRSWVKTTGGKGLHVTVPIARRLEWDVVKEFSHAVAVRIAKEAPDRYTSVMSRARRAGRIYVDYLRNARGATSVAPYSTRAREGAPVSTPIEWDELGDAPVRFDVTTLPSRLSNLKRDPWKDLLTTRQAITQAMTGKLTR